MIENTPEYFKIQQYQLAQKVQIPSRNQGFYPKSDDLIFTLDVQYQENIAFTALDICTLEGKQVGVFSQKFEPKIDYFPSFFGFREAPILIQMIEYVSEKYDFQPQLIITDGHGTAHPRRFGIACHVGVNLNVPTIGIAKKTLLKYQGDLSSERGSTLPIFLENQEVGKVLRSQNGINPIFVSSGHLVNLANAIKIALILTPNYRLPEPIRRADHEARQFARQNTSTSGI